MHGTAQKTGPSHKERWNQCERAKETHRMGALVPNSREEFDAEHLKLPHGGYESVTRSTCKEKTERTPGTGHT